MKIQISFPKTSFIFSLCTALFFLLAPLAVSVATPIKVACVGDSITYGYLIANRGTESYPAQLQKLLSANYEVQNFGVSGSTLLRKGHHPYDATPEFKAALAFHPDVVVIDLGVNDTDPRDWPDYRDQFAPDYAWLIAQFRQANPNVKISICILTPIFEQHPRFVSSTHIWEQEICAEIPQIASANRVGLIDLHTPLFSHPNFFARDGVHPTAVGAAIMAKTIAQSLTGNFGGLQLAKGFGDHMVLPHGEAFAVSGKANRGEVVTLRLGAQNFQARADENGDWRISIPPQKAGGPFMLNFSTATKKIGISDVYFGELWLCSGQSNMDFPVSECAEAKTALQIAAQSTPSAPVRLLHYENITPTDAVAWPQDVLNKVNNLQYFAPAKWHALNPADVKKFSAVGYFFAQRLAQELKMPIGIVQVSVGGSSAESWIDRATMEDDPLLVNFLTTNWRTSDFVMDWCRQRAAQNLAKSRDPFQRHPYQPCYNFEAGIAPILKLPIKGVVWYQGESNTQNPELFAHLFPALVKSWRTQFGKNLPFFYVQISGLNRPSWPRFRDTQRRLADEIPNSGMVVNSDLGEENNVHYHRKEPVGERLADLALERVYHAAEVDGESPLPLTAIRSGDRLIVNFKNSDGKLQTSDGQPLRGFELRDLKGNWRAVPATISGNSVRIQDAALADVDAVAYAWQPWPHDADLVNGAHLPASTFILRIR